MSNVKLQHRESVKSFRRVALIVVALGILFYFGLLLFAGTSLERFGLRGDAMAPFAALLSAATLFAAIDGMRMQREELRLQRRELVASRKAMRDQADAAKETTEVQRSLVVAQEASTRRQHESNLRAHYAQIASIESDVLQLVARIAEVRHSGNSTSDLLADELDEVRLRLIRLREYYEDKAGSVIGVVHLRGPKERDGGVAGK